MIGTVYIIHFDHPYKGVQHYVGWAKNVPARLSHHKKGTGANLLRHVTKSGINFKVVSVFHNEDKKFERRVKDRKKTKCFCPVCNPEGYQRYTINGKKCDLFFE